MPEPQEKILKDPVDRTKSRASRADPNRGISRSRCRVNWCEKLARLLTPPPLVPVELRANATYHLYGSFLYVSFQGLE